MTVKRPDRMVRLNQAARPGVVKALRRLALMLKKGNMAKNGRGLWTLMPPATGGATQYGEPSGSRCSGRALRVWLN